MPENKGRNYISLALAAKLAGLSRKYLNVLVHREKIRVEKMNGQWFTTREWLNEYLGSRRESSAELTNLERKIADLAGKFNELAESKGKFENAYIEQNQFIQEQFSKLLEGQSLSAIPTPSPSPSQEGEGRVADLASQLHQQIEALRLEKQELAFFFTRQLEDIKTELEHEQLDKQALLFELQHLKEQIDQAVQSRLEELAEQVNEKLQEKRIDESLRQPQADELPPGLASPALPLPKPIAPALPLTPIKPLSPLEKGEMKRGLSLIHNSYFIIRRNLKLPQFKFQVPTIPAAARILRTRILLPKLSLPKLRLPRLHPQYAGFMAGIAVAVLLASAMVQEREVVAPSMGRLMNQASTNLSLFGTKEIVFSQIGHAVGEKLLDLFTETEEEIASSVIASHSTSLRLAPNPVEWARRNVVAPFMRDFKPDESGNYKAQHDISGQILGISWSSPVDSFQEFFRSSVHGFLGFFKDTTQFLADAFNQAKERLVALMAPSSGGED